MPVNIKIYIGKMLKTVIRLIYRSAFFALFAATFSAVAADEKPFAGVEQFNPDGEIDGEGRANIYDELSGTVQSWPYTMIDGMAIYQGDIVLGPVSSFKAPMIIPGIFAPNGVALTSLGARWPSGIVYYDMNGHPESTAIRNAMDYIEENTSIRYLPRNGQSGYIYLTQSSGCFAFLGFGGAKQVNIGPGCQGKGTTTHELFHSLGVHHEQVRSDRDSYVTIHFENIEAGKEHNFEKSSDTMDIGSYDYNSIMHYGTHFFTKNGQATISTKPPGISIGNRAALSEGDIATIQYLYYTDLQLELSTVSDVIPGAAVQASIEIQNLGDTTIGDMIAKDVIVDLSLPSQSAFNGFTSSENWNCQQTNKNVECSLPILDRNAATTLTLNLIAPVNLSSMQLNASVSASNRDINQNNNASIKTITISGTGTPDTAAPTAPSNLMTSDVTETTVDLDWTASTDNVGVASYDVIKDGAVVQTVRGTSARVIGLAANTSYNFTVKAKDPSDNMSVASNTVNVTTSAAPFCYASDVTLTLILDDYPQETGWILKNSSDTTISSGASYSNAGQTITETISLAVDDYTFTINDSAGDGICCGFGIGSYELKDANDLVIKSGGLFTNTEVTDFCIVTAATDTQAPAAPDNLTASNLSEIAVDLNWTASTDNVGVTGYIVYEGATQIGTTIGTTYQVTGLTTGITYNFSVLANDAAGNVSAASNSVTVTAGIDTDGDGISDNVDTAYDIADGDVAALIAAINAANDEGNNPGLDIIELAANGSYQLTTVEDTSDGNTGLPAITSGIIINGNGATISGSSDNNPCDGNGTEFRLFLVNATSANLTLNNTTISGGCTFGLDGGGVLVDDGSLNLNNSAVLDTAGQPDGGLFSNGGTVTINR